MENTSRMDLMVSGHRPRGRLTPFVGGGLALLVAGSLVTFTMLAERADLGLGNPRGIIPTGPDATAQRTVVLPGSPSAFQPQDSGAERVVAPLLPPVPIAPVPDSTDGGADPAATPAPPEGQGPVIADPDPDPAPPVAAPGSTRRGPSFAVSGDPRGIPARDGCDDAKHEPKGKGRGHCKHSKTTKQGPRQQPAREQDPEDDEDDDEDDEDADSVDRSRTGSHSARAHPARDHGDHAKAKLKEAGKAEKEADKAKGKSAKRGSHGKKHRDDDHSNDSRGSENSKD